MTCKDCVHYEVCKEQDAMLGENKIDEIVGVENHCEFFKPKSRFVELPCVAELYCAASALADMVNQFGYSTTFRKQEAVIDGGLSALENAFGALYNLGCSFTSNGKITRKSLFEFQERMEKEEEKALEAENALYWEPKML